MIPNPELESAGVAWLSHYDKLRQDVAKIGAASWQDMEHTKLRIEAFWTDATRLASLLRNRDDLCGHLQAWAGTHGRFEVYVAPIESDGKGILRMVVAPDGISFIDGGEESQARQARNFDEWFVQTVARPFPWGDWGKDFIPLDGNIWGSRATVSLPICGFPEALDVATDLPYRLAGFAGYGTNSYAIYVTEETPRLSMRFRFQFGGAYGDPEKEAGRLVDDLVDVQHFLDEYGPRFSRIELRRNISRCHLGLWRAAESEFRGPVANFGELRTRARDALAMQSTPG
jgi:hypothetical protein